MTNNLNDKHKKAAFHQLTASFKSLAISAFLLIVVLIFTIGNLANSNNGKKKEIGCGYITAAVSNNVPDSLTQKFEHGRKLFKANCNACHLVDRKMTGPDLAGINEKREKEWLYKWIRNNFELRKSGDAIANEIFNDWNGAVMTAFPQLTDEDIDAILLYVNYKAGA